MDDHTRFHGHLLYLFLFLSGFAGLGYEIVWTRMLSAGLGHEILAVLAVVTAFFAGLALGAWALDQTVSRSSFPGRWYAGLEAVIGLWSLVLSGLLPWTIDTAHQLLGPQPAAIRQWNGCFHAGIMAAIPWAACMPPTHLVPSLGQLRQLF
jgi:spermidine synthase